MRSKSAAWQIETASRTCLLNDKLDWRVANERIYTRGELMAFIRMRSPRRAPPVLRLDGSTEIMANFWDSLARKNRKISSSISDDLPAPPVPVMPRTEAPPAPSGGAFWTVLFLFSALVISRAICAKLPLKIPPLGGRGLSHFSNKSFIIPCKPILRPSSGEYSRVMP